MSLIEQSDNSDWNQVGPYMGEIRSLSETRKDIFNLAKQVIDQCKSVFIHGRTGRLVLMSLVEYNKLINMARLANHYRSLSEELEETITMLQDEKTMSSVKSALAEGPDSKNLIPAKEVRRRGRRDNK